MFRLILIAALAALATGAAPRVRPAVPMLDGRIVGGKPSTIEDRPYQASLEFIGYHICGASLIGDNFVLTAAHCTEGQLIEYLAIRAGSALRETGGQVIEVAFISQHPRYDSRNIDYDVSAIRLKSGFTLGPTIQPIALHQVGAELAVGSMCTVSGWGYLAAGGSPPKLLQEVDVPYVSQDDCKSAYGSSAITDRMLCCGYPQGGKDACQGDSGGPIVHDNIQVGIVSWGRGCASPGYPGVYTRVANKEIRDHISIS